MICPNCHLNTSIENQECDHCKHKLTEGIQKVWEKYNHVPVQCPECGKVTKSLKVYKLPDFCLCLLIYSRFSTKGHIGCPSCMRKKIMLHGLTYNIITANIIWLFIILPWTLINFLRTFSKGHSWEIVDHLDNTNSKPIYK